MCRPYGPCVDSQTKIEKEEQFLQRLEHRQGQLLASLFSRRRRKPAKRVGSASLAKGMCGAKGVLSFMVCAAFECQACLSELWDAALTFLETHPNPTRPGIIIATAHTPHTRARQDHCPLPSQAVPPAACHKDQGTTPRSHQCSHTHTVTPDRPHTVPTPQLVRDTHSSEHSLATHSPTTPRPRFLCYTGGRLWP